MDRSQLEALSTAQLKELIAEATAVLASKASGDAEGAGPVVDWCAPAGLPFVLPARSSGAAYGPAPTSGMFSFGKIEATSSKPTGGLFASSLSCGSSSDLFSSLGVSGPSCEPKLFGAGTLSSQSSLFGNGKPFGGSTGLFQGGAEQIDLSAPLDSKKGVILGEGDDAAEEEEILTVEGWQPSISLEVLDKIATGEEDEEQVYSQRAKLYRFRDCEWKERGQGEARLLRHKVSGRARFLMRQEKSGKVVANHFVLNQKMLCNLKAGAARGPSGESDKIWTWQAQDSADGDPEVCMFALRFRCPELASQFKEAFNSAKTDIEAS